MEVLEKRMRKGKGTVALASHIQNLQIGMAYNGGWSRVTCPQVDVNGIAHGDLSQKRSDRENFAKKSIRKSVSMECCKIWEIKSWVKCDVVTAGQGEGSDLR